MKNFIVLGLGAKNNHKVSANDHLNPKHLVINKMEKFNFYADADNEELKRSLTTALTSTLALPKILGFMTYSNQHNTKTQNGYVVL